MFFSPSGRIDPPLSAENREKDQLEKAPLPLDGKRTILVVDDDEIVRAVVANILADYNVNHRGPISRLGRLEICSEDRRISSIQFRCRNGVLHAPIGGASK